MALNPLKRFIPKAGSEDKERSTLWTTPWRWRTVDGIYVGHNKEVWMYREMALNPVQWEDNNRRLEVAGPLAGVLEDIGGTSKDVAGGIRSFSRNREIHILSVTWDAPAVVPKGTPEELNEFLEHTLDFLVPHKSLMVGVKLRSSIQSQMAKSSGNVLDQLKNMTTQALGEEVPDLEAYESDINLLGGVFKRNGGREPTREALNQLESWYNLGRGPDVAIQETKDLLYVDDFDTLEFAAVMRFENPVFRAPNAQWILDATSHPEGPAVVSVRAELEPSTIARSRLRRNQRKFLNQMEEQAATQDLERVEDQQALSLAKEVEDYFVDAREPLLAECSIVLGRRTSNADETYVDELKGAYGIDIKPLQHRQLAAMDETLPTSSKRVNPFLQDVNIGLLAYAGLQAFSNLGDRRGLYVGLVDPDYTPCWLDPFGAPNANLPPATAIFGDPGGGKTFLCQMLAVQAALAGIQVIMINPKGYDSLSPTAELVNGTVVKMTQLEKSGGYFDPARFAPSPEMAAEIASSHILAVLGSGFNQQQELRLSSGLKRGFVGGAKCVAEALQSVDDPDVRRTVQEQAEASTTFALGIGTSAQSSLGGVGGGLTLIEFDRKLDLPEASKSALSYTREQKIALGAIRLVTRASLEILSSAGGGIFILDEAWTFLSSSEGLATLQQLGREGRSLNILPIFATQRVADLVKEGINLEGYISRVFVMKLMEEKEAKAALMLCGLEATPGRINWLRQAGPRKAEDGMPGRAALALHRDLKNRHAAVMVGPVPEAAKIAFSTNPEERRLRNAAKAEKDVRELQEELVAQ